MADTTQRSVNENPTVPVETLIGQTVAGRYKIEALLGEGGMGAVYLAQHTAIRKRVALKMLHAETSQNPELVARFEREAVAAANVDHPNVATASDFGRAENGQCFLVLEYLEGQRLRDVLSEGPVEPPRAVHIVTQVASALQRSQELGVIHRDLKPENIMLVPRGADRDFVKVLDFGLAKLVPASTGGGENLNPNAVITKHGTVFGTPRYMAPEQCVTGPIDHRADLYALGIILFEMLTGAHPFPAKQTIQVISHQLATPTPPLQKMAPNVQVPAALEAVVMRLTEKLPEKRYPDAAALLTALADVAAREGWTTTDPTPAAPVAAITTTPSGSAISETPAPAKPPAATDGAAAVPRSGAAAAVAPPPGASSGAAAPAAPPPAASSGAAPVASPAPASAAGPVSARPSALQEAWQELRAGLPGPLQARPYLLVAPLLLSLFLCVMLLRSGGGGTKTGRKVAQAPTIVAQIAPADERQGAAAQGIPALLSLAAKYPQDAASQRAVALAFIASREGVEALRWLAKAVALRGSAVLDSDLQQAAMLALSTPDTVEPTLQLLESGLGARGVDALYLLAARPGPARLKARIRSSLSKPEVRALASPAALVALDLRTADSCELKRGLLPRTMQAGDARSLAQLKSLLPTHNCGPYGLFDCWECLRKDGALQSAIAAIETRLSHP